MTAATLVASTANVSHGFHLCTSTLNASSTMYPWQSPWRRYLLITSTTFFSQTTLLPLTSSLLRRGQEYHAQDLTITPCMGGWPSIVMAFRSWSNLDISHRPKLVWSSVRFANLSKPQNPIDSIITQAFVTNPSTTEWTNLYFSLIWQWHLLLTNVPDSRTAQGGDLRREDRQRCQFHDCKNVNT